ncbi:4-(cytidine 5'-diphospho)-2-C-methyl-D-erythritol kinase [Tenericutes bacterium MO-XQ]|nr:4-(cytidine 5'-diphospho)-2-C-methyl-D-erythritol kinase [Tenericutes bacterium MO-XQ]
MIYENAHAKINLILDVDRKRNDGYHDLNMIMIPIDLHDRLSFEIADDINLTSDVDIEDNAIIKTAKLMQKRYDVKRGVHIILKKRIPIGAGLAGGSADIAATIRGLNKLWDLNLPNESLENIALELGSDTLFCLYEKPAYVSGRGEYIKFLETPHIQNIYLFCPDVHVSTQHIFKNHHITEKNQDFQKVLSLYENKDWSLFYESLYNDLLPTTLKCYPDLNSVYQSLKELDEHLMMSGSGSTFFLINSNLNIHKIIKKAKKMGVKSIKTSIKM